MPFVPLEGETLILVHIFALTEFGFPGQLTLPRRPVATVGTKVTKKTLRPRTWTLREVPTEDNLQETDNVQLDDRRWTLSGFGPRPEHAPREILGHVKKLHRTLGHPATPLLVKTLKYSEPTQKRSKPLDFFNGVHARRHPGCRPNVLQPNTEQSSSMNGCSSVALKSSSPQVRRIMWAGPPSALQFDAAKAYTSARWEQVVLE